MDGTPSRRVSFCLQVEETTTDDEILLDNRHLGKCDSMDGEMDRPETIFGIEEGLECGISKTGDVQPDSPVSVASLLVKPVCVTAASFCHGPGVFRCLYHVHSPFALITR